MTTHTENSKNRIRESLEAANGTAQRFQTILGVLNSGGSLCLKDYGFYRRYCKKNGIVPLPSPIDRKAGVPVAYTKPLADDQEAMGRCRFLVGRLDAGRSITIADYRFLKRYCRQTGMELPKVSYSVMVYKVDVNRANI